MSVLPHYERMLREYKCCTPKESVLTVKSNLPKALRDLYFPLSEGFPLTSIPLWFSKEFYAVHVGYILESCAY